MDLRHSDPTDGGLDRRWLGGAVALFLLVAALAALDLAGDLRDGTTVSHAVVEGAIVAAAAVGVGVLVRRLLALSRRERDARRDAATLAADLERARAESARWRTEARDLARGLGELIDAQLVRWGLTPAEKDVALLLLKGLSHKEIAAVRKVGEPTVRQQAAAIYRKSGVGGRHDLSAFFLEDLLAPRDAT